MKIILYKTADENVKVSKTLNSPIELNGTLRAECSVLNPAFEIQTTENISNYNYARIEDFNRYYYITDIVAVNNKLWKVSLKCDVLMSYKESFDKFDVIVNRSQTNFNNYINDGENVTLATENIQTIKFPITPLSKQMFYIFTTVGGVSNG